jgi:hypothetical protein
MEMLEIILTKNKHAGLPERLIYRTLLLSLPFSLLSSIIMKYMI